MRKRDYCQTLLVFIALIMSLQTLAHAQVPGDLPALTVLVRHADRDPGFDPPLNADGVKRVQDLAATVLDTKFSAIITSDFIRTRDTAKPVAEALGLTPAEVKYKDVNLDTHVKAVVDAVRRHSGGVVLVVGHSETLKDIIAGLRGPRFTNDICRDVYDHLFVLVPTAGNVQLIRSRYGRPSPPPGPGCM